jgi:hypothetical protein
MQLEVAMVKCTLYVEYADLFWQFICIIYELQIYSDNSECLFITSEDSQPDFESQQSIVKKIGFWCLNNRWMIVYLVSFIDN